MGKRDKSIMDRLASVRLTVLLIALLALSSVVGTLVQQNQPQGVYIERYGPGLFRFLDVLGLFDLYHSWWFRLLIAALAVNLVICSLKRLPKALKLMGAEELSGSPKKLLNFKNSASVGLELSPEEAKKEVAQAFSWAGSPSWRDAEGGLWGTFTRGKVSRLGPYVVHLSVLTIILGSLIGSIFGFKGYMELKEGEESSRVNLNMGREAVALPFSVVLDKFTVSFYETGAPKEFRSDVVVKEDGKEVEKASIIVNDPLRYKGVSLYQSSYRSIPSSARLKLTPPEGETLTVTAPFKEEVEIKEGFSIRVVDYRENLARFGPALGVMVFEKGQDPNGKWILVDHPAFHGNRLGGFRVEVDSIDTGYVSGFQVTSDPGVWTIYLGFTLLIIGSYISFFMSHVKVWVFLKPGKEKTLLTVAGTYSKNPIQFEKDFSRALERLGRGEEK